MMEIRFKVLEDIESFDGDEFEERVFKINFDPGEVDNFFRLGCQFLGVNYNPYFLSLDICRFVGDKTVPKEFIDSFLYYGLDPSKYFEEYQEGVWTSDDADNMIILWLDIAKVGDPSQTFEYTEIFPNKEEF